MAALYCFARQRARELKLECVFMGGTLPYPEDGLFAFKMKWNPVLDRENTHFGFHDLLLEPSHPRVRGLLAQRSLIALDRDDRFVVDSARAPREVRLPASMRSCLAHW